VAHWYKIVWVVGLGGIAYLLTSDIAQAQPKVGDSVGDWVFNCRALSANQTQCALNQTIVETKTNRQILRLTLQKLGKEQKLALIVGVPLGVYLAAGIGGRVDDGKQFNFIWQSCTKGGCQAALGLDKPLKKALQTGKKLFIGFKLRSDSKTFTVAASLKGVTSGLKALNVQ